LFSNRRIEKNPLKSFNQKNAAEIPLNQY